MYLLCAIDHFMCETKIYLYGCRNGKVKNLTIYKVNFPFFFVSILKCYYDQIWELVFDYIFRKCM